MFNRFPVKSLLELFGYPLLTLHIFIGCISAHFESSQAFCIISAHAETFFLISFPQNRRTVHPSASSFAVTSLSRSMLRSIFGTQNSWCDLKSFFTFFPIISVPKFTVTKHGNLFPDKRNIRLSEYGFNVFAIVQASSPQFLSQSKLN